MLDFTYRWLYEYLQQLTMTKEEQCRICNQPAKMSVTGGPINSYFNWDCPTCGRFTLSEQAQTYIQEVKFADAPKIASFLATRRINNKPALMIWREQPKNQDGITVDEIIAAFPVTASERMDKALCNIHKLSDSLGKPIEFNESNKPLLFLERYLDSDELGWVINKLEADGYVKQHPEIGAFPRLVLESKGYERAEMMRTRIPSDSNQAFVAMWYTEEMRKIYDEGIKPAVVDAGFVPMLIQEEEFLGKICEKILREVEKSRFLICDVTGARPNAHFEASYAQGLGLPIIWTCRKKTRKKDMHFDTQAYRHILWEDAIGLRQALARCIKENIK